MSETPIVRRSRCGCVHDQDGHALMVCSTHVGDVEGRVGVRLRTLNGELAFFALAPADARPAPPEESLCGEEENLVTLNDFAQEYFPDEDGNPVTPPPPAAADQGAELAAWEKHCREVGRSRVKAYDEAFSLVQLHLEAWRTEFAKAADVVFAARGWEALSAREKMLVAMCCDGSAGFLREIRAVGQRVRR